MKKKKTVYKVIFAAAVITVLFPISVLAVWSVAKNWRFPNLLPSGFSNRGLAELFGGYSGALPVLISSIFLSSCVGFLTAVVGTMTARAMVFYEFRGKTLISFLAMLPVIVPATAFAMGIHVIFIRIGLSDTVPGVIIVHLICALPYGVKIMTDITECAGSRLEIQAQNLGASPFRAFAFVTLPAIMPGFVSAACMGYIISFGQYFLTLIIGGGNVKTFSMMMVPYIQSGDRTISGAYGMVFLLATLLVFGIVEWISGKITSKDTPRI